ncbi:MAG: peptidase M3 [Flavobacteriaceae bacterium CG1_02_35_72]|nr:MAG: peptidase M3 [Flavobacteriaceae bacterium CG1_02_35_72]PJA06453.1 MAG: peptidase M3 [Flavobacteriales bacterium CG_4_10_14_0_2_um_filter_35_18]
MTKNNPLLQAFNTPFQTAPFSIIKTAHFKPAFKKAIILAKQEIDAIVNNNEAPTFENTIVALDFSGNTLDRISSLFFNLNSAETSDAIQKIAQEVSPWLSEFSNDIRLNESLFQKIKAVYQQKDHLNLNTEQRTLLEKKYKSFSRNGANLNETDKVKLRKIDKQLAKLGLTFGEHILADANAYQLNLLQQSDLEGLPEHAKNAAKLLAKEKGLNGWLITLDAPSYIPFMTYAKNRALRETLAKAFGSKGFANNKNNNEKVVLKLVKLKSERAKLLGYNTHADFVLEERMAKNPAKVFKFLDELLQKAKPAAQKEFEQLKQLALADGISDFQKWDGAYYSEILKKRSLDFDEELLKPYFKLENVLDGVFKVAKKLYGLTFEPLTNIDTYHMEVKTFKVTDEKGDFKAIFYGDFFPRPGKRQGAWMTSFKDQWIKDGENSRPHISIVCNFTKPTKTQPSLLTFNEVTTLFHEFGHSLHGMLANTTYPSLSGTSVFWDFVELPSQVLENWCYEKETLDLFAVHYQTGEKIPSDLIEKIKTAANFLEGLASLRQLSFGLLDMQWHTKNPKDIKSVKAFEIAAFANTQLYPDVAENCMSTAFSHIFHGGYSAGYYSYKWAEVLDADAFAYFKANGIFNKKIADSFKEHVLSKGGTEDPMVLYKRFRGQEPDANALLKRAGLIK